MANKRIRIIIEVDTCQPRKVFNEMVKHIVEINSILSGAVYVATELVADENPTRVLREKRRGHYKVG